MASNWDSSSGALGSVLPSVPSGTGTLYAALQRMQADGLIAGSDTLPGPAEDQRRKYYRITDYGRDVARAEIRRLARVLEVASETSLRAEPAAGKGA